MDLSWGLYFPLILIASAFAIVSAAAGIMGGRGNDERAEGLRDVGFGIVLLGGVWVVILALLALISEPDDIGDLLIITLVIVAFFVMLLVVLFGLSLLVGRLGRGASRRRRVTTDEL
jgi:threonine/homoserine/homoserine lactone efflux protein